MSVSYARCLTARPEVAPSNDHQTQEKAAKGHGTGARQQPVCRLSSQTQRQLQVQSRCTCNGSRIISRTDMTTHTFVVAPQL
jgi:hypothetical protein